MILNKSQGNGSNMSGYQSGSGPLRLTRVYKKERWNFAPRSVDLFRKRKKEKREEKEKREVHCHLS